MSRAVEASTPSAEVMARVRAALTGVELTDEDAARERFSRDESGCEGVAPQLVVFARSEDDVCRVLRVANAERVPVTPVGARTGKSGGSVPAAGGIALSLEKLTRVVEIVPDELRVVVEPGVLLADVYAAAEAHGLWYPPDPNSWPTCTVGGTIAENAGGPVALKYGVTRDYVLGLRWVLPTGEPLTVGRRTSKGVAGYDLVSLFVGSEGTLGVCTQATLRLVPKPRGVATGLVGFVDTAAACRAVSAVLGAGLLPRCLELLDDVALAAIAGQGLPLPSGAGAVLIVETDGHSTESAFEQLLRVEAVVRGAGALDVVAAQDESQRERIWAVRRSVSPALRRLSPQKISEDVVVPRSRIPEAVARFKALGAAVGLTVATYGHVGDGNLHTNVLFAPHQRALVDTLLGQLMAVTVELGGTITGEHGVGLAKKQYLSLEQAPLLVTLQRQLQGLFDPAGVMNPGKIFPAE